MLIRYMGGNRSVSLELPTGNIICMRGGDPFEVSDDIGKILVARPAFEKATGSPKKVPAKAPEGKE